MACSEARLAANRANAQKSTGPQTDEGKERSRRNALKHGLTGAGVVVPGEDAAEIRRQADAILRELAPDRLPIATLLAERVATLAVRLKRSARHEFAATAERAQDAALDFDEVRRAEAGRLFDAIDEGSNRDELMAMPEGLDLLDAAFGELRAAIDAGRWAPGDSARLARCLPPEARAHAEAVGRALTDGDLSGLDRGIVATMDPARVRGPWAVDQVIGLIEAGRDRLESARPALDAAAIARLRVEAVNLVLVDAAPETLLARRYEAATERALFRALKEIREARREARDQPEPAAPAPAPFPTMGGLVRQADEMRSLDGWAEPAPAPKPAPALGSIFPGPMAAPAAPHRSKIAEAEPAPRGRSRYEDRRQRPKLGR